MDEEKATEQMTVLVVEPGYAPYEKTIPHELHAMQEIVGGLITVIYPYEEPVGIVANDEGLAFGHGFQPQCRGRLWWSGGSFFRVRFDGGQLLFAPSRPDGTLQEEIP